MIQRGRKDILSRTGCFWKERKIRNTEKSCTRGVCGTMFAVCVCVCQCLLWPVFEKRAHVRQHQSVLPYCVWFCLWKNVSCNFAFWTSLVRGGQSSLPSYNPPPPEYFYRTERSSAMSPLKEIIPRHCVQALWNTSSIPVSSFWDWRKRWGKKTSSNSSRRPWDFWFSLSIQFSCSVVSNSLDPMDCSMAGLPVHHQLLELAQTHVHWVSDVIQPAHPLSSPSPAFNLSIFSSIRVFSNESVLHIRWPKYWSFNFSISHSNEYSGLISFSMDWLDLLAVQGTLKNLSPTPQFKSINSLVLRFLYSPTLTSIHDYWKNYSFD